MQPHEIAGLYLNVPFRHLGRDASGLDCVGLVLLVARHMGIETTAPEYYGEQPTHDNNAFNLREYLVKNCGEPVTREIKENDILLMRFKPHQAPSHIAIAAPHPHGMGMIHTYGKVGRVVYHRIDDRWNSRITEHFAWPAKQ